MRRSHGNSTVRSAGPRREAVADAGPAGAGRDHRRGRHSRQRSIPIGTAYVVWTGIGAAGTFAVGIAFYGDSARAGRLVSVGLIIAGIIGLKLAHGPG